MADKIDPPKHVECGSMEKQMGINSTVPSPDGSAKANGEDIAELAVDPAEAKRIVRKIDIRVIPILSLLYLYVLHFCERPSPCLRGT